MGRVEAVLGLAEPPTDDDRAFVAVIPLTEGKQKRPGVLVLVEQLGTVTGNETLERPMSWLPHAPALVFSQGVKAHLKCLGKSHHIGSRKTGLKEESLRLHRGSPTFSKLSRNRCRVKGSHARPKGVKFCPI